MELSGEDRTMLKKQMELRRIELTELANYTFTLLTHLRDYLNEHFNFIEESDSEIRFDHPDWYVEGKGFCNSYITDTVFTIAKESYDIIIRELMQYAYHIQIRVDYHVAYSEISNNTDFICTTPNGKEYSLREDMWAKNVYTKITDRVIYVLCAGRDDTHVKEIESLI